MAVNGRVDAKAEHVLMVLGKGARTDDVAPVGRDGTCIDVDDRDDASGTSLDLDAGGLIELEGKDVLVVRECDDKLDDQLAAASGNGTAGAPVGVFPADAVVLLVQADDIMGGNTRAVGFGQNAIKILRDKWSETSSSAARMVMQIANRAQAAHDDAP